MKELLKLVENLDDATLITETPNILKNHPNPYTFTKHLAEHEVKNGRVPAAIVRPSMSTYIELIILLNTQAFLLKLTEFCSLLCFIFLQ